MKTIIKIILWTLIIFALFFPAILPDETKYIVHGDILTTWFETYLKIARVIVAIFLSLGILSFIHYLIDDYL